MQIRRFHVPEIPDAGACLSLPPEEAHHAAKVLRLEVGDALALLDGAGNRAEAAVASVAGGRHPEVACRVASREAVAPPRLRIRLCVAPPRGKTTALVLRAAVELGVWRITPILCQYSVARPDQDKASWRAELVTAMKQSGNPFLPALDAPCPLAEALVAAKGEPGVFGAVPGAGDAAVPPLPREGDVGLWVGPEGGFSPSEETLLRDHGFVPVTVGRWILRVETAVPALLGHMLGGSA